MRTRILAVALLVGAFVAVPVAQAQKPITNADVVGMVKAELAESTIIAAIEASPIDFDISPMALIALKERGVSVRVMDAMLAEAKKRNGSSVSGPAVSIPPPSSGSLGFGGVAPVGGLQAAVIVRGERRPMEGERTHIEQTRAKPTSMGALSKDRLLVPAVQEGVRAGASAGSAAVGGGLGGTAISQAGGILGQIAGGIGRNTNEKITYVWALPGSASTVALPPQPTIIEVSMERLLNVSAEDYAPVILQLAVTDQQTRLVGATEGKTASATSTATDWQLYESFVEDVVVNASRKTAPGKWEITASLPPGSYAVALRPLSKSKKFSGRDVTYSLRDGLVFNSVWAFDVR